MFRWKEDTVVAAGTSALPSGSRAHCAGQRVHSSWEQAGMEPNREPIRWSLLLHDILSGLGVIKLLNVLTLLQGFSRMDSSMAAPLGCVSVTCCHIFSHVSSGMGNPPRFTCHHCPSAITLCLAMSSTVWSSGP